MAKEDFCFTYYDGDAARDKAHMNRLERGAYDDIISAQRKRGHLSLDDVKKVLGNDFDTCWNAMQWVLLEDESGKFYIEWLEMSLNKMKAQSRAQSSNGAKGGRPKKAKENPIKSQSISEKKPLVYGDGDVLEKEVQEEKQFNTKPKPEDVPPLNPVQVGSVQQLLKFTKHVDVSADKVIGMYAVFRNQNCTGKKYYASAEDVFSHYLNWIKIQKFEVKREEKKVDRTYKPLSEIIGKYE